MFLNRILPSLFLLLTLPVGVYGKSYVMNDNGDTLIGEVVYTKAELTDTLLDIGRRHGFGYFDMKLVNPDVDTWLPGDGQDVVIPSQFILPHAPRTGIVMNVPEMRLYYYPPKKKNQPQEVITYPLGVGREGWNTPYITTKIVEKKKHPNWYPPASIRKEHEEAGDPLPKIVKAGPDNPLGDYAMRLGQPEYLIHGTNKPYGVGMRVSHGCIRLYPEDIEALYENVSLKTPVKIINQPYKVGVKDEVIYLEAHPFLEEDKEQFENNLTSVVSMLVQFADDRDYEIDWATAYDAINNPTGVPVVIGMYLPSLMQAKVEEKLSEELTKAEKVNLQLRLDSGINLTN